MSTYLLTLMINNGAPFFGVLLFLGALGFPVGASVLLIAAGAFAQQGVLSWNTTAFYGLLGAVCGDAISFGLGVFAKDWVNRRFGNSAAWQNARQTFDSRAAIGSGTTALAVNFPMLFAGWSVVEGLGAVLVIPAIAALTAANYTGRDRAIGFGILGGVAGAAAAAI